MSKMRLIVIHTPLFLLWTFNGFRVVRNYSANAFLTKIA